MKKMYDYNDNITVNTLGAEILEICFFDRENSILLEENDVKFLVLALTKALETASSNPPPDTL